jgi:hypothetical protein
MWEILIPFHKILKLKVAGYSAYFEKLEPEYLEAAHAWMKNFFDKEAMDFRKVYKLRTPEQWASYKLLGVKGLREQYFWSITAKAYREKWLASQICKKELPYVKPKKTKQAHKPGPAY